MENKYEEAHRLSIDKLPKSVGKYVYSEVGLGYFVAVMLGMFYLRFKSTHHCRHSQKKTNNTNFTTTYGNCLHYKPIRKISRNNVNRFRNHQ